MSVHEADAVFQGGGVKGLALVGALAEFSDQARHPDSYVDKWVNVAGTSAGAIVAAYLACGHSAEETVELVKETPFAKFCDWGPGGKLIGGALNLLRHHGLTHGEVFHHWFRDQTGGKTFGDIQQDGRTLKVIAADITRREMLVLPDALANYKPAADAAPIDPPSFGIADAVRMSMSIPFFFQPIELVHVESGSSMIVDGGVLSNFPVWIFDVSDHDPVRPTFGFKLTGGRSAGSGLAGIVKALGWPIEMGADVFHTSMDAWDKYWVSHASYVRTCEISAGDVGTTDFDLTADQKTWLVKSGHAAASEFLAGWNPGDYVNRHGLKLANEVAVATPA